MKYLKEVFIKEIHKNEIDVIPPYYTKDEPNNIIYSQEVRWQEVEAIDIDFVREALTKLEKQGSKHVYIYPHVDHHGYVLTGVRYDKCSKEEYDKFQEFKANIEIEMLEQKKRDIDNEINRISLKKQSK